MNTKRIFRTYNLKHYRTFIIKDIVIKPFEENKIHVLYTISSNPFEKHQFALSFDYTTNVTPSENEFYSNFLAKLIDTFNLMGILNKSIFLFNFSNCLTFNRDKFSEVVKELFEDPSRVQTIDHNVLTIIGA